MLSADPIVPVICANCRSEIEAIARILEDSMTEISVKLGIDAALRIFAEGLFESERTLLCFGGVSVCLELRATPALRCSTT